MDSAPRQAPALRRWQELALAAAIGAGHTWAYVETQAWWLQMLAVALLAWRLVAATPRRAAAIGLVFGTAWLCAGTWWLFISMHRYGGLPAWMAALAVLALSSFLSLYMAAALAAFARWRSGRAGPDALLLAAVWLLAELARGVIFTGFPWVASGYAHVDGPLARLAPLIGVYGIGAVATGVSAWVVLALSGRGPRRHWAPAATAALLLALGLLPTIDFSRASGQLDVVLLQGNIPQDEKFDPVRQGAAIEWHVREMLAARGPDTDLVIGPETALVIRPDDMPPGFWDSLRRAFADGRTHALIGIPLGNDRDGHTNSAVGLVPGQSDDGADYRYDKFHLVPFGEFIPPGFRWFTEMMHIPLGDFNRGPLVAPSLQVAGERVAPNICYEDLFGEELAARFRSAETAPTILANISNIAWFGDTIAIDQHLQISRMRSLELQRPMLRATNTGATVAIDHRGRVVRAAQPHRRVVLRARVEGRDGLTPFAFWAGRLGLWPLGLAASAIVLLALRRSRSGRRALAAPVSP
ncbi:apolipoprotein N-acyltransferase [Piscinibacter sakaiensis]|uniref:apolipoprotein N-acyltransferase n=1 Tax=Piscinibacter sakaiensis TaxID=1547922 RepID=UPI003AAEC35F